MDFLVTVKICIDFKIVKIFSMDGTTSYSFCSICTESLKGWP